MTVSDDDIWQGYIKTVKPLKTSLQNQHISNIPIKKSKISHDLNLSPPFMLPLQCRVPGSESLPPFAVKTFCKKLQTSAIDATLDLHGKIMKNAYAVLVRFIEKAVYRNHRIILIITGKSLKKVSIDAPRLVEYVPLWLKSAPLNQYVKNVTYARREHGGHGAYYVFLKLFKDTI